MVPKKKSFSKYFITIYIPTSLCIYFPIISSLKEKTILINLKILASPKIPTTAVVVPKFLYRKEQQCLLLRGRQKQTRRFASKLHFQAHIFQRLYIYLGTSGREVDRLWG